MDSIDVSDFHKDVIHEAMEVKSSVTQQLSAILSATIERERFGREQAAFKAEKDAMEKERQEFEDFKRQKTLAEQSKDAPELAMEPQVQNAQFDPYKEQTQASPVNLKIKLRNWQLSNGVTDTAMGELVAIEEIAAIL